MHTETVMCYRLDIKKTQNEDIMYYASDIFQLSHASWGRWIRTDSAA